MALLALNREKVHVFGRDIRWAYFKALVAAVLSVGMVLAAAILAVHMFLVSERADQIRASGKTRDLNTARRIERASRSQEGPTIFFLTGAAAISGILAVRFYNHAKSEFPS